MIAVLVFSQAAWKSVFSDRESGCGARDSQQRGLSQEAQCQQSPLTFTFLVASIYMETLSMLFALVNLSRVLPGHLPAKYTVHACGRQYRKDEFNRQKTIPCGKCGDPVENPWMTPRRQPKDD
jgi:hypothetical protein